LDSRFCSVCNRAQRSGASASAGPVGASLADILQFLNDARRRATYGAVASVLGVPPRSMGALLGAPRAEASWVVNGDTGLPSGYEQSDWHRDLLATSDLIRTGHELTLHMAVWRTGRK
jgi:alkylated DNA nucleotide flippase Atl1